MIKRTLSPPVIRVAARGCGEVMRVDIHPADFDQPSHISTLERVLDQARGEARDAVTYDDLSAAGAPPKTGVAARKMMPIA